jgi:hypothetical protein
MFSEVAIGRNSYGHLITASFNAQAMEFFLYDLYIIVSSIRIYGIVTTIRNYIWPTCMCGVNKLICGIVYSSLSSVRVETEMGIKSSTSVGHKGLNYSEHEIIVFLCLNSQHYFLVFLFLLYLSLLI